MPSVLDIHDVTVAYHRKPVLWDVDLVIPEPQLAAIVGPNGAGKSTLIKAVLGLVPMASGRVQVFGKPVARVRKRIGYVPQRESVDWDFPVSVLDVVLMGTYGQLGWFRRPGKARARHGPAQCLAKVGLAQLRAAADRPAFRRPAAAGVPGPGPGPAGRHLLHGRADGRRRCGHRADDFSRCCDELRQQGKTIIVVHHDLRTVPQYFDYVVLLNVRLVAAGPTGATSSRPRTCARPTAAGWRCSIRSARPLEAGAAMIGGAPSCSNYNTLVVLAGVSLLGASSGHDRRIRRAAQAGAHRRCPLARRACPGCASRF